MLQRAKKADTVQPGFCSYLSMYVMVSKGDFNDVSFVKTKL